MPSLSSYDKGTRGFEGRRYNRDIEAVKDANEKLWQEVNSYNKTQRSHGHKTYKPRKVITLGNHESRISRAANSNPELDGTISLSNLGYAESGWEVTPFKEAIVVDGIAYSHYFASGLTGQAISGENIGSSLVKKLHMSAVQGHSHLFSHYEHTRPNHEKIFGMSVGCFTHHDYNEDWCKNTQYMWWRGIVVFEGCGRWSGYYEQYRAICQQYLLDKYL